MGTGLGVSRETASYPGVTGSPVHCEAVGQGAAPGLAAPSCLGVLLGHLPPRPRGLVSEAQGRVGSGWALTTLPPAGQTSVLLGLLWQGQSRGGTVLRVTGADILLLDLLDSGGLLLSRPLVCVGGLRDPACAVPGGYV